MKLTRYAITAHGKWWGKCIKPYALCYVTHTWVSREFSVWGESESIILYDDEGTAMEQADKLNRKGCPCATVIELTLAASPYE